MVPISFYEPANSPEYAEVMVDDRPNILFILSDQHTHWACGFAGHPEIPTPNLDRLAARGTRFSHAYCNSPSCTPSRASFFTGRYGSDVGSFCNSTPWSGGTPTWGTLLGRAGYHCEAVGKFDLSAAADYGFGGGPHGHGHDKNPDITSLFRCPGIYRWNERTQVTGGPNEARKEPGRAEKTVEFLRGRGGSGNGPWAYYTGFHRPHPPFTGYSPYFEEAMAGGIDLPEVPDEALRGLHPVYENLRHFKRVATPVSADDARRARAGYYAMIRELDDDIGRILDALEESGQADNTVVVYASDHGESLGENGLWFKCNLYDVAARVPLLFSGPGIPAGAVVDRPVSLVDVTATLLDLAGAPAPEGCRGRSLRPLWRGEDGGPEQVVAENHTEGNGTGNFLVRRGDWKLIYFAHYGDGMLFNVAEDPAEFDDRYNDPACADIREDLLRRLREELDPEAVSDRAFATQANLRKRWIAERTEAELADSLESRLGTGQARVLARELKRDPDGPA